MLNMPNMSKGQMKAPVLILAAVLIVAVAGAAYFAYSAYPGRATTGSFVGNGGAAQGGGNSAGSETTNPGAAGGGQAPGGTGIGSSASDDGTADQGPGDSPGSAGTTDGQTPVTYTVDIRSFAFSPKTITINKGDTVVWTNYDSVRHTVTSDQGGELDSALLSDGASYSHVFDEDGTFSYHCTPHPSMKGTVIVNG